MAVCDRRCDSIINIVNSVDGSVLNQRQRWDIIMGTWRVPTAFVLFAQLLTLSTGNIDGTGEFEKILSKNVSIVLIENKTSEAVNEALGNETSLTPGYNNFSMAPDTTTLTTTMSTISLEDEKILEDELKEAIENAASTGEVILISTLQAENSNSTAQILGPLIFIENPITNLQSSIDSPAIILQPLKQDSSGDDEKKIIDTSSFDQEIAQSQIRPRSNLKDYGDDDNIENLQDLLAIADYEPQKIDAKRIEQLSTQPSRDERNDQVQSTTRRLAEETHYDVPKRVNSPRNSQRIREYQRPTPNSTHDELSTYLPYAATSTSSNQSEPPERESSSLNSSENNYKAERRKFSSLSSASSFNHKKLMDPRVESSREPRHLQNFSPLTTTIETTHIRNLSPEIQKNTRVNDNLANITESSRQNVQYLPSINSWISPFGTLGQDQTSYEKEKNFQTIPATASMIPQAANRRLDDYSSSSYVNPPKHEINPLSSDQRLGFLTRYNLPSLVTGRISKPRSNESPALLYGKLPASAEKVEEEEKTEVENSSEEVNSRDSRTTNVPVEYSDEESEEKSEIRERISERPSYTDESRKILDETENKPIYDSYEDDEEPKVTRAYRGESAPSVSTTPLYESYEVYEKSERPESTEHRDNTNSRLQQTPTHSTNPHIHSPTKTIYHPYDYRGNGLSPVTTINNLPNADSLYSTISSNNVYDPYKNYSPGRSSTISQTLKKPRTSYETYEDYEESPSSVRGKNNHNLNWLDERYENFKKSQKVPSSLTKRVNHDDRNGEKNRNGHSTSMKNHLSSLPSTRVPLVDNSQRNLNHASLSSSVVHVESPDYHSDERDEKIYSPTSVKQRIQHIPHYEEQNNRLVSSAVNHDFHNRERNSNDHSKVTKNNYNSLPLARVPLVDHSQRNLKPASISSPVVHVESPDYYSDEGDEKIYSPISVKKPIQDVPHYEKNNRAVSSSVKTPVYRSNEDNDQDYILSASREISTEPKSADYGNRLRPSMNDEDSSSHSHTRVSPVRSRNLPIHRNDNRRIVPARIQYRPVESPKRADLEDAEVYEDEEPASSGRQENHESHAQSRKDDGGGGDVKSEKGGGEKHQEAHHETHGEKGEKGYTNWHESDKGKKGHHDKEHKEHEYEEKKGDKKEHEDVSGYHEEAHHGEKGEKESEFGEKGHNEKGHSTKGMHVVHKKDEYEKKTEFYDESHEEDDNEKEGEYHHEHEKKKGGHEKIGHHESEGHEDKYGEKGEHEKGQHYDETKGHEDKGGREQHHSHEAKYGKKGGHEEGEKWSHKKGDNRKR